ncbi:MAG: hypothetical protein JO283_21990 [Bradyrhizobium sp.]|nr:hypothetical protein [Bradyrhizobium sp.]
MKGKLLSGTACAALCLLSFGGTARSATLEDVMARLDKIEKENAELRAKVRALSAAKPAAAAAAPAPAATDPSKFKGNPVLHGSVATSPTPPPPPPAAPTIGGIPVKAGPLTPLIDNTTVTLYGSLDCRVTSSIRRSSTRKRNSE